MRTFFAVFAALIPLNTHAVQSQPTPDQACSQLGNLAAAAMQARQENKATSGHPDTMAAARVETRELMAAAYQYPQYPTPDLREKAVEEFRDTVEFNCTLLLRPATTP